MNQSNKEHALTPNQNLLPEFYGFNPIFSSYNKKPMKNILLLGFFLLLLLPSCNSGSPKYQEKPVLMEMASTDQMNAPPPPMSSERAMASDESQTDAGTGTIQVTEISRKIIRDGSMEIRVNELQNGKSAIDTLVKKYKGYYSNETFNNMDYSRGFNLTIRIPSSRFDEFITAIETGEGEVVFKNISSRDVTEEFIDLETRKANKKNYLNRYSDLLKQARSVKDILEIQEKTRLIEEEVESVQGRLKYLNNQVDYSTLTLQISKKNDYNQYSQNKGSFFDRLKMSLVKGWFGLVSFALFLIRIWPFWLIAGGLFYIIRRMWRKRKK